MQGLSRRGFLGGAAGVAAAVALPPSHRTTQSGIAPITGAIVNLAAYHTSSYLQAAELYNSYVGMPLATRFEKIYMTHGQFGSTPPAKIQQLASAGCDFLVSVEPSRQMTAGERTIMAKWLAMLTSRGISYRVALYSECNDKAFTSVGEWLPYWRYYASAIKDAGVALCYEPGCGGTAVTRAEAFFPTKPAPDELWLDYYATAFRGGSRLDKLIAIAQTAGVPVGIGEFGWSAGNAPVTNPMTMPWWDKYGAYLIGLATQGKLKLGVMHYSAKANNRAVDVITGPNDPRIPMVQKVVKAVQKG